jgi:predicted metal-dependent hydrolase
MITTQISFQNIEITLQHKPIKTIRLIVYPPDGRVRLAVPMWMSAEQVDDFLMSKLRWIKERQEHFRSHQPKIPVLEMGTGAEHLFFGRAYPLEVFIHSGKHWIELLEDRFQLFVRKNTSNENRFKVLENWYRVQLIERIEVLLDQWQPILDVQVEGFRVQRMQKRWGTCYTKKRRICLSLYLVAKPVECLEYVLVHELVHLLERYHNERFYGLLDRYLPDWQQRRSLLNN